MFRADGLKIYPTLVIRGTGKKSGKLNDSYQAINNYDIS